MAKHGKIKQVNGNIREEQVAKTRENEEINRLGYNNSINNSFIRRGPSSKVHNTAAAPMKCFHLEDTDNNYYKYKIKNNISGTSYLKNYYCNKVQSQTSKNIIK